MILRERQFSQDSGFLRDVREYFETRCRNKIPVDCQQAEFLHYLFVKVQHELKAYLNKYLLSKFWIRVGDIEVSIIPGVSGEHGVRSYQEPFMRISLSNLSFIFDSGSVSDRFLEDYSVTKKFDIDTFLDGYFFDSFDRHPLKDFLYNSVALIETASVCVDICIDGREYFLNPEIVDSMKEELGKYDTADVDMPDYSVNPFDFLEMIY